MKIVIDISEEVYNSIQDNNYCGILNSDMYNAVKNGTPFPKNHGRKFEEIVVEYPPAELCTYPEYKGKPYFSIKYEENGKHIIGFGTYNPEFLSEYLREYFIAQTNIENVGMCQQNVGEMSEKQTDGDLISKSLLEQTESLLDQIRWERDIAVEQLKDLGYELGEKLRTDEIAELRIVGETTMHYECSLCGGDVDKWDNYCKHCGARMKEVEE